MAIEMLPVPPLRDLSQPQDVRRLIDHLNALWTAIGRLSDNADLPDTPTAIVVRQGAGKTVEIVATFAEPPFPWTAQLWRSTSNDVTTATQIDAKTAHSFHDVSVSYASTYYYWVRTGGLNGVNLGGWSPSSGHSITVSKVVTGDINALAVGTTELAATAVTTAKIADLNVTTGKINDLGVTTGKVAANAITTSGTYDNINVFTLSGSEQEIGTITISTDGGPGHVIGKTDINLQLSTTAATLIQVLMRKDSLTGTIIGRGQFGLVVPSAAAYQLQGTVAVIGYDSSPAATQTYKLSAYKGVGTETASAFNRNIIPVNLKK